MTRDWETTFVQWAQRPGKTEQDRCDNAIGAIRNAIAASPQLRHRTTLVFPQGSYRNRVNVSQDSDVDALYNLAALTGVTLASLNIQRSYTGMIGLPFMNEENDNP